MAHPDLEKLLNTLLPFAQQMLSKYGEFYPFGATMSPDGQVNCVATHDGAERPESQKIIDMMTQTFGQKAKAGEIHAAGICMDIRTIPPGQTERTDAICVCLEHQSGEAVDVCVPYKKGLFKRFKYAALFASRRTPQFFIHSGGED